MSEEVLWITPDVGLPRSILDAQVAGRLVFFVGAGASFAAPSGLPLFGALARQLAERARMTYDELVPIDYFLGAMPDNFDTHAHAHQIIARADSRPNSTHHALVRLASSMGPLRIVTTNFDDHLASAASAEGMEIADRWTGPALPLGHDFEGLVHLHGSVLRSPRELVLTDSDFGRAYLTSAWATRFLLPMFQRFTVVFIGYSHDDPIMQYLALGLPSATPRFAFTDSRGAADPKWRRLGVQPVGYPVPDHDHSALVRALEAWNDRIRMGRLDHQARVQDIVVAGPTMTPVERDYLNVRLRTLDGVRDFAGATAGLANEQKIEWLRWFEESPEFKLLFGAPEVPDSVSALGDWFSQTFITSPELHGAALQTLHRLGQSMTGSLFRVACWATEQLAEKDAGAGERWRVILATSVLGHSAPLKTEYLLPFVAGAQPRSTSVLRTALRPFLKLKRRWTVDESEAATTPPDAEAAWAITEYALTQHVRLAVNKADPGDVRLGGSLEEALASAYDLHDAYHGRRVWDPLTFGRSAIEPHEQDSVRDPIDAVIDGLREFGVKAQAARTDLPERWWALDRPLFRRLALHLVAVDPSLTADARLEWLLGRTNLYAAHLKHETFQILATAASEASELLKGRLLATVNAGPDYPEDAPDRERHVAYGKYNLLVWLTSSAPDWAAAAHALDAIRAENPSFGPREHPDFDSWTTSGVWGGKLPMEPKAFVQSLQEDPSAALEDLLSRDYSERSFDEPSWRDVVDLVERSISERPDLGTPLWMEIDALEKDASARIEGKGIDLRCAIVEGWSSVDLEDTMLSALAQVKTLVTQRDTASTVGRFLSAQVDRLSGAEETLAPSAMREIASTLWREHSSEFTRPEDEDPLSFAPLYLNSWPGDLAQYWISELDRRWRLHRDDWVGLSEIEQNALVDLLRGSRATLDATQPAIARQLFFLFSADPAFTVEHVLPIFRADDSAMFAWYGYLQHPRYDDRLLDSGLLDSVVAQWERLDALQDPTLRSNFFGLVASILSFATITSDGQQALLAQSVLANDGAYAIKFAGTVAHFLRGDGINGAEIWTRWLRDHLTDRLNGVPRTPNPEELARWADIIPQLGEAIPEALALFSGRGVGLGDDFFVIDFPRSVLADHGPALVAHYAERVQNTAPRNRLLSYQMRKLFEKLRVGVSETEVQSLVAEAIARGLVDGEHF
ncbi:SIR2 family protein [Promicromonospora sp. NPDC050249]|uniref:SIR2 family protein n=1 Tax=Promicromonospora sp. NPDC050249 TaxID=3154743 RepID=UPI0033DB5D11